MDKTNSITSIEHVFQSNYEAFGLVVVESLSAGTPVIISIKHFIDFGEGTADCKAEEIPEIIEKITDNFMLVDKLSERARQNALDNYTWDKIAENHLKAFADFQP